MRRDQRRMITTIITTRELIAAAKKNSVKLPNCPRPYVGSMNYFVNEAILDKLKECGIDYRKIYPEIYGKSIT